MDHNVPTAGLDKPLEDPISAKQMDVLARNCEEFGIRLYGMRDPGQGIVHVIGPEQGLTQPGMTIVCGDSHTSTHGWVSPCSGPITCTMPWPGSRIALTRIPNSSQLRARTSISSRRWDQ